MTAESALPEPEPVRIDVRAGAGRYAIEIAPGATRRLPALLDTTGLPARRFIVSSPTVWRLHGDRFRGVATAECDQRGRSIKFA